ncbi:peptidoglycan-binding protein [Streptomyces pactum]|uniref:Peptidoglycan binding-like domain-containing protein n=1 Tax=Streptomyces pactum TaxID=68249 RepID=A0A1S6J1T4_9ACTN|nr:peptidoglycan-binding domain-containing protein [Streptomyces pactum]AQS65714.1 hypothetical protein B1H29_01025 [Streptomyces pactum]
MSLRSGRAIAVTLAFLSLGGLAVSATPAAASPSAGVVTGAGLPFDDFGDEGPVSASSHAHSNLAAMWQAILWADASYEQNGTPFDLSDIDCRFGPNTTYATKRWQARFGLARDGIVGPNTFGALGPWSGSSSGGVEYFTYHGENAAGNATGREVAFRRNAAGEVAMWNQGDLKKLWYNSATFDSCS